MNEIRDSFSKFVLVQREYFVVPPLAITYILMDLWTKN